MVFSRPSEKMDWSTKDLAQTILQSTPLTALIFCDTNFFSSKLDFVAWDAILTRKIAITPLVWTELQPWIHTPRKNQQISELVKHAATNSHEKFEFIQRSSEYARHGFDHYFALLTCRKRRGVELYDGLEARLGRVPTDGEFRAECQRCFGDRGTRLAYKGWESSGKPNAFADEELVVLAVQTAILRGVDVVIFSRDLDVEEQFVKLMGFFQHDYSAMLVAERYETDPGSLRFEPGNWPPLAGLVEDEDVLMWKTDMATIESLKPSAYKEIRLHTVIVGTHENALRVTPVSFTAETGLKRLLAIKSSTRGLNTDKLAGKNCRLVSVRRSPLMAAVLCRDKLVPVNSTVVPALDKRFAMCVDEDVAPVEWLRKPSCG